MSSELSRQGDLGVGSSPRGRYCFAHVPLHRRSRLALGAAFALTFVLLVDTVGAQSASEVGAARQLFERGLSATRAHRWRDAEQAFAQSYAIVPRVSTLLNLGGALEQLGRLVEASEAFRRVLADRSAQAVRLHESAEGALERISSRIGRLRWEIEGGFLPGDRLLLDGAELAEATGGVDIPVDPGTHALRLERGGSVRESRVNVDEGQQRLVLLRAPAAAPSGVDTSPSTRSSTPRVSTGLTASPSDATDGRSRSRRRRRWLGVVAGLAVVGAALAIGFSAADRTSDTYRGNLGEGRIRF